MAHPAHPETVPSGGLTRRAALLGGLVVGGVAIGVTGCSLGEDSSGSQDPNLPAAGPGTELASVDGPMLFAGDPVASAIAASALFARSKQAVVLRPDAGPDDVSRAADAAIAGGVPCLVDGEALAAELDRLGVEEVQLVPADAPWSEAVTSRDGVEELEGFEREETLPLLVTSPDPAAHAAAVATVQAAYGPQDAGAVLTGEDFRRDEVVAALRAEDPPRLVAVGDHPGIPADLMAPAAAMAMSAPQLPGGGVLPFPGRRMIALYGHPGVPGLGILGEQDVDEAVTLAREYADRYSEHSEERVIPAFEIIATIADSGPGDDGDYSAEAGVDFLRPWVAAAKEAGIYVTLDLQPGRADFLSQAKRYEELLKEPHVGLALDPEWRIGADERPLERIGHVEIEEVNEVAQWLAELTREAGLPQKVFTLHQFQLQMLRDRDQLRTDLPEIVTLIHADGHGTPDLKQGTWTSVKEDLPDRVVLGWKNFIDEDTPTFTPEQTMKDVSPAPWFVSYQ